MMLDRLLIPINLIEDESARIFRCQHVKFVTLRLSDGVAGIVFNNFRELLQSVVLNSHINHHRDHFI